MHDELAGHGRGVPKPLPSGLHVATPLFEQILSPALHTGGPQTPVGSQTRPPVQVNWAAAQRVQPHFTQIPKLVLQSMPEGVQALSARQPVRHVCDTHFCPVAQSVSPAHSTQRPLTVSQALPLGQSVEVVQGSKPTHFFAMQSLLAPKATTQSAATAHCTQVPVLESQVL